MIDFTTGGLTDIWPNEGTQPPEIQALSYALQNALILVRDKADETRCYGAIDMLPESILDYFAVELRTMYYDQSLDIEQKRSIVKNTVKWYTYAGTPYTVEEMVAVIFGEGKVVEWFDYDEPPYTPGTFDIVTSAIMTSDIMERLSAMIKKAKNTRSHIRRVIVERTVPSAIAAAIYQTAVQETTVLNILIENDTTQSGTHAAGVSFLAHETETINTLNQDAETAAGQSAAFYGSTTDNRTTVTNETTGDSAANHSGTVSAQQGKVTSTDTIIKEE